MKKRVKRKGRRSVIEKNTADFNKEFRSQPRREGWQRKREREREKNSVSRSPHSLAGNRE